MGHGIPEDIVTSSEAVEVGITEQRETLETVLDSNVVGSGGVAVVIDEIVEIVEVVAIVESVESVENTSVVPIVLVESRVSATTSRKSRGRKSLEMKKCILRDG